MMGNVLRVNKDNNYPSGSDFGPRPREMSGAYDGGGAGHPVGTPTRPPGGGQAEGFIIGGGSAPRRRVVVCDESVEFCQQVGALLDRECACETVSIASIPREAVDKALTLRPDLILLSETAGPDAADALRHLRKSMPLTSLIYVQGARDERAARDIAHQTGAIVLAKPLYSGPLVEAVNNLPPAGAAPTATAPGLVNGPAVHTSRRTPGANMPSVVRQKTVAVISSGGSGKSTISRELCGFIGLRNTVDITPLLWDCNVYHGHQRINLNLRTTKSMLDLVPYLNAGTVTEDMLEGAVVHYSLGHDRFMDVLLAPAVPTKILQSGRGEITFAASGLTDDVMETAATVLSRFYPIIIADMSQDPHDDRDAALLQRADCIIQVIPIDDFARVADQVQIYSFLREIGIKMDKVLLAINNYTRDYDHEVSEVATNFGREISAIIPFDANVRRMCKEGGILSVTKASPFVFGIEQLATKICPTPPLKRGAFRGGGEAQTRRSILAGLIKRGR